MNYLAHGIRFLDRPYFMAGTAVPDWLSVVDRRVRMRTKRLESLLEQWPEGSPEQEVALGILQHLSDDDWFHTTLGFSEVTGRMTRLFREHLDGERYANSFLGHIVTELLIDAELSERHPARLEGYYDAMRSIHPLVVQTVVNTAGRETTDQLARFIPLFVEERFLADYRDSAKLWRRLNQVMKRVKLELLPESIIEVLDAGRVLVAGELDALLPANRFMWP
ncbi:MAG: hypothetical protein DWH91_16355 [Planctomycetota bacterium]|nr:MAG: hypothetical protein DWH91_16355 [Planctomycetota bacterium]